MNSTEEEEGQDEWSPSLQSASNSSINKEHKDKMTEKTKTEQREGTQTFIHCQ